MTVEEYLNFRVWYPVVFIVLLLLLLTLLIYVLITDIKDKIKEWNERRKRNK